MCDIFYIAHLTVRYFSYRTLRCAIRDLSALLFLWSKVSKWYIYILLYVLAHLVIKSESNMIRIVLIIPSSTSQNITFYSYCILISLPVLYISFCYSYTYSFNYWHPETRIWCILFVDIVMEVALVYAYLFHLSDHCLPLILISI